MNYLKIIWCHLMLCFVVHGWEDEHHRSTRHVPVAYPGFNYRGCRIGHGDCRTGYGWPEWFQEDIFSANTVDFGSFFFSMEDGRAPWHPPLVHPRAPWHPPFLSPRGPWHAPFLHPGDPGHPPFERHRDPWHPPFGRHRDPWHPPFGRHRDPWHPPLVRPRHMPVIPFPEENVDMDIFSVPDPDIIHDGLTRVFTQVKTFGSAHGADQLLRKRDQLEKILLARGLIVQPNTVEAMHNQVSFAFVEPIRLGRIGFITSESLKFFSSPSSVRVDGRALAAVCPKEPICRKTKYRTIDGSCNNIIYTAWGKANRAFKRMTPPTYADGISKPRVAIDGGDLTSCRLISSTIIKGRSREYSHIDHMFMAFGQFVDHDLTLTPTARGANNSGIVCCPPLIQPEFHHPECFEIQIPANDPFYSQFNTTCMEFVRTIPAPRPDCKLGPREQINQLTNYLDGSMIYGSSEEQSLNLRDKTGGRLRVGGGSRGREFPPHLNTTECRGSARRGMFCFVTGDVRVQIQPALIVLHIVFLREHNRIAAVLEHLNPRWSDEILFQEARRIVQAQLQHIIYNEFLPILLGKTTMRRFNLELSKYGYFNQYNAYLDATIFNEFGTAAFRYGHSLIQSHFRLIGGGRVQNRQLRTLFLKPFNVSTVDKYTRGATTQACEMMDDNLTPEVTNHLLESNFRFGQDLAALNCQRGRDHAIGTYTQLRRVVGLPPIVSFSDLTYVMHDDAAKTFSRVYRSVDDIDLWIGGVSERPMPGGSVVGPTFGRIIAEQFMRLRLGDRLWYERGYTRSSFSIGQLTEIRKTSLARILCDNTDVYEMQPYALLRESHTNEKVPCQSRIIPKMNLGLWRNEPVDTPYL